MKDKVLGELKNTFKPEFLNRIDEVIVFHSLRMEEMYTIVDLLLNRVRVQLTEQQLELVVPQVAKDFLIEKGFDPQYGARPLRRTIQRLVEDPLAEGLLQGTYHSGDLVEASVIDGELHLQVRNRIEQLPAPTPPEAGSSRLVEAIVLAEICLRANHVDQTHMGCDFAHPMCFVRQLLPQLYFFYYAAAHIMD